MIVYQSDSHKFVIVTEQRTGSSFLFHLQDHCDLTRWAETPPNIKLDNLRDIHAAGYSIFVAVREPVNRRASAVSMISKGGTTDQKANWLRGKISSAIDKKQLNCDIGIPNYTLNDSHCDWGTSIYYYIIRAAGIHCRNILIDTGKYFDWYDRYRDEVFTMDAFMRPKYKHIPEALEYLDEQSSHRRSGVLNSILWMLNKSNDQYTKEYTPLPMQPSEAEYMFLYFAYSKAFREGTHGLEYTTIDPDADNRLLPFDTWTNLESELFHKMIQMENDNSISSEECTVRSNRILLNTLQQLDTYINWDAYWEHTQNPVLDYSTPPCFNLVKFIPEMDVQKYMADLRAKM